MASVEIGAYGDLTDQFVCPINQSPMQEEIGRRGVDCPKRKKIELVGRWLLGVVAEQLHVGQRGYVGRLLKASRWGQRFEGRHATKEQQP